MTFIAALCLTFFCVPRADAQDNQATTSAAEGIIEIDHAQVSLIQNTFVAAPISGVVAEVLVAEGEQVEAGHRLVQLDAEQAQSELEAARAAYEAARLESDSDIDARYAQRTLEVRLQELRQSRAANEEFSGSVSDTEIAELQLVVDQSRLAIEKAEHQLRVARAGAQEKLATTRIAEARVGKHNVESMVRGYVVEVAVEPGEWVEAGKPIVRIISLNPIRVECFVDGRQHGPELVGRSIEFIPEETGMPVTAANSETKRALVGKVTFVSPELHPVTGQARLWATIDNPQLTARAGMTGRIVIQAQ